MSDSAPPYEELDSDQHGKRLPSNPFNGYSEVPQSDYHEQSDGEHQHQHQHQDSYLDPESDSVPLTPKTTQPHFHCDACDRLLERQQKRRFEHYICTMVSVTFMVAFVCLTVVGIVLVHGRKH
ncbi:hypothetical protein P175DRAFT_0193278 [Aspergillus ochraceoroseus IBT 24754]|uniref:Uncharacterized protein n=1 Tax=Aspergillus ochraceoroseus IBT 24754 TaxID=1392256 RepID=A0A2T5LZC9_9EURO|nr:uncharacterized protein P175DRAFT_0193278 [Aspergillus ochraceoroseus IBT 24754]PTU21622.1 hypothetical protein P175DRAFT_0193278 [Aspergillus ochraceoroseus IBT 24754]